MRFARVIRSRWAVAGALVASALSVAACEAVLALNDVSSCEDCVGSQCAATCLDGGAGSTTDARAASGGDATMVDRADGTTTAGDDGGLGGDDGSVARIDRGFGSFNDGGAYLWSTTWSAPMTGVAADTNGNTYITGRVGAGNAVGSAAPTTGSDQIYVAKLDSDGRFEWSRTFGGAFVSGGLSIATDSSEGVYVSGVLYPGPDGGTIFFSSDGGSDSGISVTGTGAESAVVFKLDSDGNPKWARSFSSSGLGTVACNDIVFNAFDPSDAGTTTVGLGCAFDGASVVVNSNTNATLYNHGTASVTTGSDAGADAGMDGLFLSLNSNDGGTVHAAAIGAPLYDDGLEGIAPSSSSGYFVAGYSAGGTITSTTYADAAAGTAAIAHVGLDGTKNAFVASLGGNAIGSSRAFGDSAEDGGGIAVFSAIASVVTGTSSTEQILLAGSASAGVTLDRAPIQRAGLSAFCMGLTLSTLDNEFVQMFTSDFESDSGGDYGTAVVPGLQGGAICGGDLSGANAKAGDIDLVFAPDAQTNGSLRT